MKFPSFFQSVWGQTLKLNFTDTECSSQHLIFKRGVVNIDCMLESLGSSQDFWCLFHLPKFWFNCSVLYSEHQDFKSSQLILSCSLIEICFEKKVGSKQFHYLSSNLRASAQDSWLVALIFILYFKDFGCNCLIYQSCTRTST